MSLHDEAEVQVRWKFSVNNANLIYPRGIITLHNFSRKGEAAYRSGVSNEDAKHPDLMMEGDGVPTYIRTPRRTP